MVRGGGFAYFFILLAGVLVYGVGYWHGASYAADLSSPLPAVQSPPVSDLSRRAGSHGETPVMPGFQELLGSGAWFKLERWLDANQASLSLAHGQALRATLSERLNKYDALAMRRILRAYLAAQPDDIPVLFLLSDLQQMSGLPEAALETLFTIMDYSGGPDIENQARRGADQIVGVIDNRLKARGALAELEAFRRHVSQRLPSSDMYRLQWARALALSKQFVEARRVLAETGVSDVAQADIDALLQRIEFAEQGVEFTRRGDHLLATAYTGAGADLTLLVDTGASITSLTRNALRGMAAHRLPETARIRTANGVAEASVYRVELLEIQGRRFEHVRVLELPAELPGLDGLLGLDLVNQITANPFTPTR